MRFSFVIRDSRAQHLILVTVLIQYGDEVDGAVIKNLVGEQGGLVTGSKGPGKAEITLYWEPFKLTIASDSSGATTSQLSHQMGLAFPHLRDITGKLGDVDYEYAVYPTPEIKCQWPIQDVHFSYEITFQKVRERGGMGGVTGARLFGFYAGLSAISRCSA